MIDTKYLAYRYWEELAAEDPGRSFFQDLVDDFVRNSNEQFWELILEVIDQSPSRVGLARFAAGPIEDLLKRDGPEIIGRVRQEAQRNKRFLYTLGNVWLNKENAIFDEFVSILKENGIHTTDDLENLQLLEE